MEEEHSFDIVIEGTTIKDAFEMQDGVNIAVVSKSKGYGTTCNSLDSLYRSPYIQNVRISKRHASENTRLMIETLPFLLYNKSDVVAKCSERPFGSHIQYIDIDRVFFITDSTELVWLPRNKTELILDENIEDMAKNMLYKAFTTGDIAILSNLDKRDRECLKENDASIYNATVTKSEVLFDSLLRTHSSESFKMLSSGFGSSFYLYPVYGMTEISENISIQNSLKGCAYILDEHMKISSIGSGCSIETVYGVVQGKEFVRQNLIKKKAYVRVINIDKGPIEGCFTGYILGANYTQVIALDSSTRVCDEGTQLIYFISDTDEMDDNRIEMITGRDPNIYYDITFETLYDLLQFTEL